MVAGKTCPTLRKRVLARNAAGRAVWASVESYAVLLTTAGPPPSRWAGLAQPQQQQVGRGCAAAAAADFTADLLGSFCSQ